MNPNNQQHGNAANDPVIGQDLFGYPINKKYPADTTKYGTDYDGYPNYNLEVFFLDFAVEGYDVLFAYKGKNYFIQRWAEGAAQLDPASHQLIQLFDHANALVEQLEIDNHKLIDIIEEVEIIELS